MHLSPMFADMPIFFYLKDRTCASALGRFFLLEEFDRVHSRQLKLVWWSVTSLCVSLRQKMKLMADVANGGSWCLHNVSEDIFDFSHCPAGVLGCFLMSKRKAKTPAT